ncbi:MULTISPECIES: hypothetical protein [unclassified Calothrix]|nr:MULTISPECIES: hypothetical protein [unclassified Calothrix]
MKPSKKAARRLAARISDYEQTINKGKYPQGAFTKPGSNKR